MECNVDHILIGATNLLCRMYWANGSSDKLKMEGDAGHPRVSAYTEKIRKLPSCDNPSRGIRI